MASPLIVVCRTSKKIRCEEHLVNYDNVACAEVNSTGQEAEATSSRGFAHRKLRRWGGAEGGGGKLQ